MADALKSMANLNNNMEPLDLPTDPDAQATVTDFLDFTEYLPSDMIRSLTLIGNLDQTYITTSACVNDFTRIYGNLPRLPVDSKPDPVHLRGQISQDLNEALRARTLSSTEAVRMAENVDRHYNRAKNILVKLQAMAETYPSSREPSPNPQKSKSPVATRAPKINLRLDGARSMEGALGMRVRKHRAPRITVPGEVLAPYELDYESYGSETDLSDSDDDEPITPRQTPARSLGTNPNARIKLKIQKNPKSSAPKPPRVPRPPGVMGTNVHSAVAGISTSNALAKLQPPPPDAVRGSADAPWLALTEWELGMLRKRMKKNAVWSPSDTMIARELKQLGRGIEAYRAAKNKADATGQPMDQPVPPQLLGQTVAAEGAISVEAVRADQDLSLINRGMKLNEAKKLKRETQAKEIARAEEAAAEANRKISSIGQVMKGLFETTTIVDKKAEKSPAKKPSKTTSKKRKRESDAEALPAEKLSAEGQTPNVKTEKPERPLLKRSKTETPVPVPQPIAPKSKQATTPVSAAETPAVDSIQSFTSDATPPLSIELACALPDSAPKSSPTKAESALLPPGHEWKKDTKSELKKVEKVANTRARRSSVAAVASNKTPTPAPEPLPARRPTSSRSMAASEQSHPPTATATIDRPRRTSTARNTPAPTEARQTNKRSKRPAPGIVTEGSGGSTAVSVGKRKAATRRKAGVRKEKKEGREGSTVQEVFEEYDDEGNLIDPEEPRYCFCNRVSFGTMIACENGEVGNTLCYTLDDVTNLSENCEKEWFHLECVGLSDIPSRTTKWYCTDCRKKLNIGQKGEVNSKGKKK
jgi:hypothetical protein